MFFFLKTMVKRTKYSNNLISSLLARKWCEVYQYLNEAYLPDSTNTYPLHTICGDPTAPMKVVTDIYRAYPQAAMAKDSHQETPISIAVDAGFDDAVIFLANECPESCAISGSHGATPILSVIYYLKFNNMLDSMITANPESAFIRDDDGDSAFDCFFRHWNVFMRIVVHNPTICEKVLNYFIGHGDWKIRDILQKTIVFLRAANIYRRGKTLDDSNLLHAALREESCHWAFCKLLMKLYPEHPS